MPLYEQIINNSCGIATENLLSVNNYRFVEIQNYLISKGMTKECNHNFTINNKQISFKFSNVDFILSSSLKFKDNTFDNTLVYLFNSDESFERIYLRKAKQEIDRFLQ